MSKEATVTPNTNTSTNTTKKVVSKVELPAGLNVSQTIRALHTTHNMSRGDIVRYFEQHLGRTIRYQHVRNVLITPVKKA